MALNEWLNYGVKDAHSYVLRSALDLARVLAKSNPVEWETIIKEHERALLSEAARLAEYKALPGNVNASAPSAGAAVVALGTERGVTVANPRR
jgi:hypothetical protein